MSNVIHRARLAAWRRRLASYDPGRTTAADWCKANGIARTTFGYWQRRLEEQQDQPVDAPAGWLSVETDHAPAYPIRSSLPPSSISVRVGAATIEVAAGFDPALLAAVVRVLEAGRC